jgi:hypothetical protein
MRRALVIASAVALAAVGPYFAACNADDDGIPPTPAADSGSPDSLPSGEDSSIADSATDSATGVDAGSDAMAPPDSSDAQVPSDGSTSGDASDGGTADSGSTDAADSG